MADVHFFDVNIAKLYGINCAVILQNIWHWIRKNEANGTNFHDGTYWTYNSTKAFKELFPYLSQRQIETALKKLRDEGVLITGNYNAVKYDRTLWYAITQKGKSILHTGEMENTSNVNGNNADVEPIPDINSNLNSNRKQDIKYIVDFLNTKAGTSFRETSKQTQAHINARLEEGFTIQDFEKVITNKCKEWLGTDFQQYLRPSTLFGGKFEGYLNSCIIEKKAEGKKQDNPYEFLRDRVTTV